MGSPVTLPLSDVVNVTVLIAPQAPPLPTFNQGLIVGSSTVIPSWGANSRVRKYTSLSQMLADGFTTVMPEYIAASLYFSQSPAPQVLYVGRQDATTTTIATAVPHTGNLGLGYVAGDLLYVAGGTSGVLKVVTTGTNGTVTSVSIIQDGTGYTAGSSVATTTNGAGTNALVDITVGAETLAQAAAYCRGANFNWYGLYCCGAVTADHEAIALWAQTAAPVVMYFYNTADSAALNNNVNNVFAYMKASLYNRTFGIYSTTQGGVWPNNIYSGAALMGTTFGLNTGLAGSYFTMKFKQLIGISTEPVNDTQVANIEGNNGNLYVSRGGVYNLVEQGVLANGAYADETIQLDMLAADIQLTEMDILMSTPALPQTDPGEAVLIHGVNDAAGRAVVRGFIAPGNWGGVQIIALKAGDPLPSGFLAQAYPYSTQSAANKQARQAMPIYLALIEAGAVHFLTIGVYVQR